MLRSNPIRFAKPSNQASMMKYVNGQAIKLARIISNMNSRERSSTIFGIVAPSDFRIPISLVLWVVLKEERPNRPKHATKMASAAKTENT